MPAIHPNVRHAMGTNVSKLRDRMLCLNQIHLTHEEALELIAPADHLHILRSASQYADISASEAWTEVGIPATLDGSDCPRIGFYMRTHAHKEPPLRPRNPDWQQDAPAALKVINWATKQLEQYRMAAATKYVLECFAAKCETGSQVRFLWPSVMLLTEQLGSGDYYSEHNDRMAAWAARNAEFKPQRSVPSLSPSFRKLLQDTSVWVTQASLLGKDLAPEPDGEVTTVLFGANPFFVEPGVLISRV